MKKDWTAEDDAQVLALDAEGLTRRQIAERLDVTRNAICGKLHRLKPRCAPMPENKPMPDEPEIEALPGRTLGKWWDEPVVVEPAPEIVAPVEVVEVVPVAVEAAAPPPVPVQAPRDWLDLKSKRTPIPDMPEAEASELQRLCEKYNFVVNPTTDPRRLLENLRGFERDDHIFAEYAWKIGERVIFESGWCAGMFICGDGTWDRPEPTIGRIDMIKYQHVRVNFDAKPNEVTAWVKINEFCRLKRVK